MQSRHVPEEPQLLGSEKFQPVLKHRLLASNDFILLSMMVAEGQSITVIIVSLITLTD